MSKQWMRQEMVSGLCSCADDEKLFHDCLEEDGENWKTLPMRREIGGCKK